jgi:hypothetical protein
MIDTYEIKYPNLPSENRYSFVTSKGTKYEVQFARKEKNFLYAIVSFGVIDFNDMEEPYLLTNEGDVFKVMETISEIIRIFIASRPNIRTIEFTALSAADESNEIENKRMRLYKRYIPKIFDLNKWNFEAKTNTLILHRNNKK